MYNVLNHRGNIISEMLDIVNCLGEILAKIGRTDGGTPTFQNIKAVEKVRRINFTTSSNTEPYNDSITMPKF